MAVALLNEDYRRLVEILIGLKQFRTENGRVDMVSAALQGAPDENKIWGNLSLGGDVRMAAGDVVRELASFGRVTPDREALGIFLNYLLVYYGESDEKAEFVRSIIDKYQMDRPVARRQDVSGWKVSPNEGIVRQEAILGENSLRDVRILQLAMNASRGVLLIETPKVKGSGFLVAPDLVMTNNHVLADQPNALASQYRFNFQLNQERLLDRDCTTVLPLPGGKFYTNPDLDFTVLQIQPVPAAVQPQVLALRRQLPADKERVVIIQHPFGSYKKVAMQNNFVAHYESPWLRYTTGTEEGSSGSPVFNEDFEVVAIHHGARDFVDATTNRTYVRNEGASMTVVLDDLKTHAADIYGLIHK